MCADGSSYEADLLVVGMEGACKYRTGGLGRLRCEKGIVVDEYCRTGDPLIVAVGDCTCHPSLPHELRVRLESVDNAFEHAKAAALNMLDRPTTHDHDPWFRSDQFDNKLLIV